MKIKINKINKCKRAVYKRTVDALKESIVDIGLQCPITVIPGKRGRYILFDGLHRLEAYKALGMVEIEAHIKQPPGEFVTVAQLAKILNKPESYLRRLIFNE